MLLNAPPMRVWPLGNTASACTAPLMLVPGSKVVSTLPSARKRAMPGVGRTKLPTAVTFPLLRATRALTAVLRPLGMLNEVSTVPLVLSRASRFRFTPPTTPKLPPMATRPSGNTPTLETSALAPLPGLNPRSSAPPGSRRAMWARLVPSKFMKAPPITILPSGATATDLTKSSAPAPKVKVGSRLPGPNSSSSIVTVTVVGPMMVVPPVGLASVRVKVSFPSTSESSRMAMLIVLKLSPSAKLKTPPTAE